MKALIPLPAATEPVVLASGVINPVWFRYLVRLHEVVKDVNARGILALPGVSLPAPITDGQVLVFDGTSQTMIPGNN